MAALDADKLHDFLSAKARKRERVTEREVATKFDVDLGAVKKRFGLLAGRCVLGDLGNGEYDCSAVLRLTKAAFESAGSQGKSNQEFFRALMRDIDRLTMNNDIMRERLEKAHAKLRELNVDPKTL